MDFCNLVKYNFTINNNVKFIKFLFMNLWKVQILAKSRTV